jgi:hypothetical protein
MDDKIKRLVFRIKDMETNINNPEWRIKNSAIIINTDNDINRLKVELANYVITFFN